MFVVEGKAPELKWEAMMKRQQLRFPGRQGKQSQHRQGRRNFNRCLKEVIYRGTDKPFFGVFKQFNL